MRILISLLLLSCSAAGQNSFPGNKPVAAQLSLFAENIVSDGMSNRDFTLSPDGNELFYTVQHKDFLASVIIRMRRSNGVWSRPEVASFSGRYKDLEASFSPDGRRIYFSSNRPSSATDSTDDFDIWYTDKTATGWGEPVHAGFTVNTAANEFYPSVTRNGNLYFTAEYVAGKGKEDIFLCAWKDGRYQPPVSLPEAVNSKGYEFNAYVDPDEQFIIFTAYGRADDMGRGDLYISRKDAAGNWSAATNMGPAINSPQLDYCPSITPDKKIFFFTSNRTLHRSPFAQRKDFQQVAAMLNGPGNGLDDIYWVKWPVQGY